MSELTLQVISVDTNPPSGLMRRTFGVDGGSIGRDESNFFVLPDQHRRVSRVHATVSFPGGVATITNASSSLTVEVGDVQLERGDSVPLLSGALVEIGPYSLRVIFGDADLIALKPTADVNDVSSKSPMVSQVQPELAIQNARLPGNSLLLAPTAASATLPDDLDLYLSVPNMAPLSAGDARSAPLSNNAPQTDPFANLLAGIGSPSASISSSVVASPIVTSGVNVDPMQSFAGSEAGNSYHNFSPISPAQDATLDPFEMPSGVARNSADPLAILLGRTAPSEVSHAVSPTVASIDSLFHANSAPTSDPFNLNVDSAASVGIRSQSSTLDGLIGVSETADPLALFGVSGTQSPLHPPMRDDSKEVVSSFTPPLPVVSIAHDKVSDVQNKASTVSTNSSSAQQRTPANVFDAPVVQIAANLRSTAVPSTPDALTAAFLQGAGLPASALPQGLTPEVMNMVGSILRSATGGAIDMLSARAATKREVQASVTIISVQANNPLKFMPNVDAALTQLLGKKMPGFMRADVAMRDAFDDLRAHEVGVIAGTRAALTEVLGKFDPTVLGDKLARGSVLESLMPSARKAKLWDKYLERYVQIRSEAEDDFQSIFGRAFVQAYESETARIKSQSGPVMPFEG
jgi:FHA domain-containing protein